MLIAVSGCTGTGKTKLGIELAKKYGGEVISADSMQIYKGLDIITNTVTAEEADGIRHHCVNYVAPDEQYNVIKFIDHTMPIIEDIFERDKTPIIVGGTAYYLEALLWEFTLFDQSEWCINDDDYEKCIIPILESQILNDYEKLLQLDPTRAQSLHPNDCRKIKRSLDVIKKHGISHSVLLDRQHQNENAKRGKLRWDGALLFSIECNQEVLDKRLDLRIEKMMELGLQSELDTFASKIQNSNSGLLDQVIGFKEFESYLNLKQSKSNDTTALQEALKEGIQKMKTITRRYSRKQARWIKNRLEKDNVCPNYYFRRLDSTFPEKWDQVISCPVYDAVDKFFSGNLDKSFSDNFQKPKRIAHHCKICDVTCIGEDSFTVHIKSRKHRRKKAYKNRTFICNEHRKIANEKEKLA